MKIDVVVPTYNRQALLRRTLDSLLRATVPDGLEVAVYIVDNNSPDTTAKVVGEYAQSSSLPMHYVLETRQGSSQARNAGIAAGTGDLLGFIDDDEEVDPQWFEVAAREMADGSVDYIGGPYLANWVSPVPDWLPPGYHSAIGAIPPKPRSRYGPEFGANLMSGNCVIRRSVFERVGTYSTTLGRTGKGLLSEEDAELHRRMDAAGIPGMYVPELQILHYIAPERLTRKYHRSWAYWRAVSQGVLDRERPEQVAYLCGVPRHRIGRALRSLAAMPANVLGGRKGEAFSNELASWDLLGFVHGRFFFRPGAMYVEAAKPESGAH